jgi:hypothetical protein
VPRLDEIEEDLVARRNRAEQERWLGEIEGIDLTLTFLAQKRAEALRRRPSELAFLGLPTRAPTP